MIILWSGQKGLQLYTSCILLMVCHLLGCYSNLANLCIRAAQYNRKAFCTGRHEGVAEQVQVWSDAALLCR